MLSDHRENCHVKEFCDSIYIYPVYSTAGRGVMYYTDRDTPAIEILSLAMTVVCLILLAITHPVHNNDSAGNKITTIPAAFAVLQVISTDENEIKTGLPQQ
jgi:hypothetical protein